MNFIPNPRHSGVIELVRKQGSASILAANPDVEVIVAGGMVRSRDNGIVGEATVDFIRQFKVDIGLIGISAIEADGTLRDFDYREVSVARIDQLAALYTDRPPPAPFDTLLDEAGVRCVVCP